MTEWRAEYELDPWGEWRADWRMGVLAASNVNLWRDEPVTPDVFMPEFEQAADDSQQSWDDQLAIAELFNLALGGADLR